MIKVVCGIIFYGNKILITQNTLTHVYGHLWEFPGGKIESEETNFEAIKREIKEELSMEVSPLFAFSAIEFEMETCGISLQPIVCKCDSELFSLNVHTDAKWVTLEDFGHYQFAPTDEMLIDFYMNALVSFVNRCM